MFRNLFLSFCILFSGSCAFSYENPADYTFKGFQNIAIRQQLNIINKLQAIADNDGVVFSKLWPKESFDNNKVDSFIYLAKNDTDSLDIIKFDYPKSKSDEECYTKDNPEFCIEKIKPNMVSYIYNERLIVNNTPDFINAPNEHEIYEVLLKDRQFFDKKPIKLVKENEPEPIYRKCEFDEFDYLISCQTLKIESDEVLYTEELLRKEPLTSQNDNLFDKVYKYVKYASNNKKIEEYIYSNNKHIFYDENGNISELYQWNKNKFKYMNKKLPDLFIDVDIVTDDSGREIEELHYDNNHKLIRKYSAEYENNKISKIHVEDILNDAAWDIIPIEVKDLKAQAFLIRY